MVSEVSLVIVFMLCVLASHLIFDKKAVVALHDHSCICGECAVINLVLPMLVVRALIVLGLASLFLSCVTDVAAILAYLGWLNSA